MIYKRIDTYMQKQLFSLRFVRYVKAGCLPGVGERGEGERGGRSLLDL